MAERLIAAVLKTVEGLRLPGVQIPPLPPDKLSEKFEKVREAWSQAGFSCFWRLPKTIDSQKKEERRKRKHLDTALLGL